LSALTAAARDAPDAGGAASFPYIVTAMAQDEGSPTHAAEPPAAVRVSGLSKRYGRHLVLDAVDLEVAAGASFGLLGLNGAGKTTLIKCLLDLCAHDAGEITLYGVPAGEPRARKRLVYLPERFVPPHHLSGREFLALMLALAGKGYEAARVEARLAQLELEPAVLERRVRALSKGMTQKLGLAAVLLVERDLYVLDEPMSGLDPASRIAVKSALQDLVAEGRTLFFTSHVLNDVEELCDSIAVLDRGAFRFRGTPRALCARHGEPNLERAFLRCIRHDGQPLAPVA
jgi:ABC-2 type transport system ATP-binding protein